MKLIWVVPESTDGLNRAITSCFGHRELGPEVPQPNGGRRALAIALRLGIRAEVFQSSLWAK